MGQPAGAERVARCSRLGLADGRAAAAARPPVGERRCRRTARAWQQRRLERTTLGRARRPRRHTARASKVGARLTAPRNARRADRAAIARTVAQRHGVCPASTVSPSRGRRAWTHSPRAAGAMTSTRPGSAGAADLRRAASVVHARATGAVSRRSGSVQPLGMRPPAPDACVAPSSAIARPATLTHSGADRRRETAACDIRRSPCRGRAAGPTSRAPEAVRAAIAAGGRPSGDAMAGDDAAAAISRCSDVVGAVDGDQAEHGLAVRDARRWSRAGRRRRSRTRTGGRPSLRGGTARRPTRPEARWTRLCQPLTSKTISSSPVDV